jgi:ligand-binding SRPBCC domain-containing protein
VTGAGVQFLFEQRVAADPARVFAFFADPRNLDVLHAEDRAFRLLHHSGGVTAGNETWIECRVAGALPVVLGFRHDACDPPRSFGERLVHGPFRRFEHRHEFAEAGGGTLVRDALDIALPRWCGGERAVRLLVAPGVRRRFDLRQRALARIFGSAP